MGQARSVSSIRAIGAIRGRYLRHCRGDYAGRIGRETLRHWDVCEIWQMRFKFAGAFAKLTLLPLTNPERSSADEIRSCLYRQAVDRKSVV